MATQTPAISVLVPIYNVEPYLSQCLESIVRQTFPDLEIICLNDGSTDSSLTIVKRFAEHDHRLTIIDKPNSGYGDSMNRGLDLAQGKYIAIVESDDWIEPQALEKLYAAAEAEHADVVKANYYRTTTVDRIKDQLVSEIKNYQVITSHTDDVVFRFAPAIWSALYRRDFLNQNHIRFLPTPGASYQDLSFSFKVWVLAQKIVLLPEAFLHYRIDNASSSVNNPQKVNCVVEEYAEIEHFLKERKLLPEFSKVMVAAKFRNYHWNFQRLDPSLKKPFYQTWRQAMLDAKQNHQLDKLSFRSQDWFALQTMLRHPTVARFILQTRQRLRRPGPKRKSRSQHSAKTKSESKPSTMSKSEPQLEPKNNSNQPKGN